MKTALRKSLLGAHADKHVRSITSLLGSGYKITFSVREQSALSGLYKVQVDGRVVVMACVWCPQVGSWLCP